MAPNAHIEPRDADGVSAVLPDPGEGGPRSAPEPYIKLDGLGFRYAPEEALAVDGVSLEVMEGDFACILGPSGCGKSTLLTILSGLFTPEAGEVLVAGRRLYPRDPQAPADRPRCGYVFQDARLLPWRTVRQNLELALAATDIPRRQWSEIIERYLGMLRIGEYADAWPMNLSGGQRHRVAIARALAVDPAFILMDEPFSTLDEVTARFLRTELLEIWRATGKTIVFVTHSIREAVFLSDYVLLMTARPGRVFQRREIDIARPRRYEDPALTELEGELVDTVLEKWGYRTGEETGC